MTGVAERAKARRICRKEMVNSASSSRTYAPFCTEDSETHLVNPMSLERVLKNPEIGEKLVLLLSAHLDLGHRDVIEDSVDDLAIDGAGTCGNGGRKGTLAVGKGVARNERNGGMQGEGRGGMR
jgi:hypothetical protein